MNVQFALGSFFSHTLRTTQAYASNEKTPPKNKNIPPVSGVYTSIQFGVILIIHAVLKRPVPFP